MKKIALIFILFFSFCFSCHEPNVTILGPNGDSDSFENETEGEINIWNNPGDLDFTEDNEENINEGEGTEIESDIDENPGIVDETQLNNCASDSDCNQGFCWKRYASAEKGICALEPSYDASLYWENSYYDFTDNRMKGSYDEIEEGVPDLSCSSFGFVDDLNETKTIDISAHVNVFDNTPCTGLIIEIHFQNDENGEIKTSYPTSESIIPPVAVIAGRTSKGFCPVSIANVPVNRWLVFKTYDEGNARFHVTYQFNIFIPKDGSWCK